MQLYKKKAGRTACASRPAQSISLEGLISGTENITDEDDALQSIFKEKQYGKKYFSPGADGTDIRSVCRNRTSRRQHRP